MHRRPAIEYKKGDKVYLKSEHLPTLRPTKKLDSKYYGPFEIVEKIGASAYRLRIPQSWKVYNVFNESLLKPYNAPSTTRQIEREAEKAKEREPDGDNEEYEVEVLLDSRISKRGRGRLEYLVKWKGYPNEESTWEPKENLKNSQKAITEFHKNNPSAPRRIRMTRQLFQKQFHAYENLTKTHARKSLFGWEDGKFGRDYLAKLERNWEKWKGRNLLTTDKAFVRTQTLERG